MEAGLLGWQQNEATFAEVAGVRVARTCLHVDEGEQLLEQLAHEERGAVVGAQRGQQPVQHRQDVAPVRAQLAGGRQRRACDMMPRV